VILGAWMILEDFHEVRELARTSFYGDLGLGRYILSGRRPWIPLCVNFKHTMAIEDIFQKCNQIRSSDLIVITHAKRRIYEIMTNKRSHVKVPTNWNLLRT